MPRNGRRANKKNKEVNVERLIDQAFKRKIEKKKL